MNHQLKVFLEPQLNSSHFICNQIKVELRKHRATWLMSNDIFTWFNCTLLPIDCTWVFYRADLV